MAIEFKNLEQLKLMRRAGLVVAETLELIKAALSQEFQLII